MTACCSWAIPSRSARRPDEETLPHLVGSALAPRYAAVNFGFSGYGPHQALAAMEHGLIDAVGCRPRHAIYLAIPDHAVRAARQRPWDLHGPRYERAADGSAVARGHFDDPDAPRDGALSRLAMRALSKSRLLDWLVVRPLTTVASDADIALMVALTQGQASLAPSPCARLRFQRALLGRTWFGRGATDPRRLGARPTPGESRQRHARRIRVETPASPN